MISQIYKRIALARKSKNISQTELANKLGVSRSAISQWESSYGSLPNIEHLIELLNILDISFEWLAKGDSKDNKRKDILDNSHKLNQGEIEIIAYLKNLTPRKKQMLFEFFKYYVK